MNSITFDPSRQAIEPTSKNNSAKLVATDTPLVSVIIPVYNSVKYIQKAIDSVLSQTYGNYEIIVVDDGSTDETRQALRSYQTKIRYVFQENQGSAAARNTGIKLANGDLVAFLDSDDFWSMPEKLAKQVACFQDNPELGGLNTGWKIVDGTGQHLKTVQPWHKAPKLDLETWLKKKCVRTSAMMFRRSWLEKVGGFDPELRQSHDVDLILRLSLAGCETDWLKEETVCYRQHDSNTTKDSLKQARYIQAVLDKFFARNDLPESINQQERQIRYHTLVWIAWYQYNADNLDEMAKFLQKSLEFSPYLRVENIAHWLSSFKRFTEERGKSFNVNQLTNYSQWKKLIELILEINQLSLDLISGVNEAQEKESNVLLQSSSIQSKEQAGDLLLIKVNQVIQEQKQRLKSNPEIISQIATQRNQRSNKSIKQISIIPTTPGAIKPFKNHHDVDIAESKKYLQAGDIYAEQGKIQEAISSYKQALQADYKLSEAFNKFLNLVKKKIEPDIPTGISVDGYRELGEKWQKQDKSDEVLALYSLALERIANNHKLYRSLADALREFGQIEQAIATYYQAIKLDSKFAWSYKGLGAVLTLNGQDSEAIAAYQKAIELKPQLVKDVYKQLSTLLAREARWDELIDLLQSALEFELNKPAQKLVIHEKLADTFIIKQDWEQACIHLVKSLQIKPDYFIAYEKIADILERQGQPILPAADATTPSTYCYLPPEFIAKYCDLPKDWLVSPQSDSEIEYIPVYPTRETVFTATKVLDNQEIPQCLETQKVSIAKAFVAIVPEGRAWADRSVTGVFTKNNKILADTHSGQVGLIFSSKDLPKPTYIDGKVAFLSVRWGHQGYFHWIYDILARIELLRLSGIDLNSIDKFVINKFDQKFQLETLAHLGIPREKIIESLEINHIQAKSLIVPSLPQLRAYRDAKWAAKALKNSFVNPQDLTKFNKLERVYINRLDAPHRRVVNEDKVIEFLESWGFTSIALESMSFSEQVLCMASAKVVIAVHGAGLSNIVFCNPGTKIIEIFSPAHVQNTYWRISNACDLEHYHLMSDDTNPDVNTSERSVKCDVCVNLDDLTQLLKSAGLSAPVHTTRIYQQQMRSILDDFVLYRIIGNDLPPRHKEGQSLENIKFILDHEPELENCQKKWILNRIVDPQQEQTLIQILQERKQDFSRIPFIQEEYLQTKFNYEGLPGEDYLESKEFLSLDCYKQSRIMDHVYHHKNLYVMNNNGARNKALTEGRNLAKWVLPWDGNCFLTETAWHEICDGIAKYPDTKYFIIPMARMLSNEQLLDPNIRPDADEEPQILFRYDAIQDYNERSVRYGRFSKIEMIWRLGVPGKWDEWRYHPWDKVGMQKCYEHGNYKYAGWVARLFSGNKEMEADSAKRNHGRMQSIRQLLDSLD